MTQSNARAGKQNFLLAMIFFLLFIPSALAYDACRDKQSSEAVPCFLLLQSNQNCSILSVTFYNQSLVLSSQAMAQYSPTVCSANFTYNTTGTYNYNYSTGDGGAIVVEEGNKMIYLLYFALALIVILFWLAFAMQSQPIFAIDGFLMLVVGVWIWIQGFSIYQNSVTQIIATVIFALGAYVLTMATLSMIEGD